jgi:hypothetical protein
MIFLSILLLSYQKKNCNFFHFISMFTKRLLNQLSFGGVAMITPNQSRKIQYN